MDNGASSYRRFLDGDKEAFREIIDLHRSNLLFFVNGLTHNLSACEDIVEDSFLELLLHPHRYRFTVTLKTYLFAIARHKAVDYLKKEARHGTVSLDDCAEVSAEYADFEENFYTKERNLALHDAMDRLKEDYRTVLYLFYFEDMGYEEAGRVMKKNRKQIENLLARARIALRSELGKEGMIDENEH